jgi:glycerol-3-phosphate acyltransferase PlsY
MEIVLAGYLLGSVPFSYLITKVWTGRDVRMFGSGNAGATNVFRVAGRAPALLAVTLDAGKGTAAVLLAQSKVGGGLVVDAAAFAAVLGHVWPVFLGFRGGKGAATGVGALCALAPAVGVTCLALLALVVTWKRFVSLGSMVALGAAPGLALVAQGTGWVRDKSGWLPAAVAGIALVVLTRHVSNLRRLIAGTEPRIGQRSGDFSAMNRRQTGEERD